MSKEAIVVHIEDGKVDGTTPATVTRGAIPLTKPPFPAPARTARDLTAEMPTLEIDGVTVHLIEAGPAVATIAEAAARHGARPLAVASINLDHIHHFGTSQGAAVAPAMGARPAGEGVEWLNLIDGSPIAHQALRATGIAYPKLSGSDLIGPILDHTAILHQRIGVLGGSADVSDLVRTRIASDWPGLRFAGHWTPPRETLLSPDRSRGLAERIRRARPDILLVCLGKPRQEEWIDLYGDQTGAGALLAFGAVVDFLAGRVSRAPAWVSHAGFEWAWRLLREPRRLSRRYLIEGPPAYLAVRRRTHV
ncbi:WecB/TagA/CpsF family glycosyltransferase [Microbacterium allomyrinae]|uniref:WecB/TagA/CpsF family glycosyltransferase n=1 Tax=Microbacterium allomyrinae TaxID=2830666 RepID=A0A9X1LWC9_9MICO|nr:WecB/TagA/CpsF family glycosyltransferase [Microbacterium allomyrinae]MCC2033031.1 WecB/TagA/CpsF family glycosyltransferase [Microbacterium allomyrinae]